MPRQNKFKIIYKHFPKLRRILEIYDNNCRPLSLLVNNSVNKIYLTDMHQKCMCLEL